MLNSRIWTTRSRNTRTVVIIPEDDKLFCPDCKNVDDIVKGSPLFAALKIVVDKVRLNLQLGCPYLTLLIVGLWSHSRCWGRRVLATDITWLCQSCPQRRLRGWPGWRRWVQIANRFGGQNIFWFIIKSLALSTGWVLVTRGQPCTSHKSWRDKMRPRQKNARFDNKKAETRLMTGGRARSLPCRMCVLLCFNIPVIIPGCDGWNILTVLFRCKYKFIHSDVFWSQNTYLNLKELTRFVCHVSSSDLVKSRKYNYF